MGVRDICMTKDYIVTLERDREVDIVMSVLPGYERDEVREATTAEILSDIRLLTVTVRGDNEKFVREIRNAVESGLREYAKESEELVQKNGISILCFR